MSHEFLDYIEDILDAMEKSEIVLNEASYEQFRADFRINFADVRALEINRWCNGLSTKTPSPVAVKRSRRLVLHRPPADSTVYRKMKKTEVAGRSSNQITVDQQVAKLQPIDFTWNRHPAG